MNKILFITAFLPHDAAAAEKNTKMMLKELSRYFFVDLIYFKYKNQNDYASENENINVLRKYTNSLLIKLINVLCFPYIYPLFTVRYNTFKMKEINNLMRVNQYNAVIFDHSQVFLYAKFMKNPLIPKLLLSHDVITQRVGRTSNNIVTSYCKFSENYALNVHNANLFTLCAKDSNLIKMHFGKNANICQFYMDKKIMESYPTVISDEYIFMGKWSRADNLDGVIWFFDRIAPQIKVPTTISIIGKDFPVKRINNSNAMIKLNILGYVDNPYPRIANCKALLSPLFTGAGIKIKVLESLACGTPVVGTDIAFEGIDEKYRELMIEAHSESEFLDAMNNLAIPLEQRLKIKEMFLTAELDETIPAYLRKLLNS